ncbi:MAG: hypothetical protein GY820_25840 [Gammaproteobacteria bacterium]|nr:hypothetical protein [Gammaproteobacteria bacterium]
MYLRGWDVAGEGAESFDSAEEERHLVESLRLERFAGCQLFRHHFRKELVEQNVEFSLLPDQFLALFPNVATHSAASNRVPEMCIY